MMSPARLFVLFSPVKILNGCRYLLLQPCQLLRKFFYITAYFVIGYLRIYLCGLYVCMSQDTADRFYRHTLCQSKRGREGMTPDMVGQFDFKPALPADFFQYLVACPVARHGKHTIVGSHALVFLDYPFGNVQQPALQKLL